MSEFGVNQKSLQLLPDDDLVLKCHATAVKSRVSFSDWHERVECR